MTIRCPICKKKSHLSFKCKCGKEFCIRHRYPEEHSCSYDKVKEQLEQLKKDNPKIVPSKLDKI